MSDAAGERVAFHRLIRFVDVWVRERLPNDHGNCAIDSGCSHGANERENFERLEKEISAALAALAEPEATDPDALAQAREAIREAGILLGDSTNLPLPTAWGKRLAAWSALPVVRAARGR